MGGARALDPVVTQVVVDASAFYRLDLAELEAVAERAAVLVSPISLCEILSHLDEPRHRGEGGARGMPVRRSRICKCNLLQALCDPLAMPTPFAGLSDSLGELRGGAVSSAAEQARVALDLARRAHAVEVLDFCRSLVTRLGLEGALSVSGPEFVRLALASIRGLPGRDRDGGSTALALEGAAFSAIYPFAGYRLARAIDHLRRTGGEPGGDATPDDMEDAHLCLHLDLLEPRALATADPAARSALQRALAELAQASAEVDAEVVALTRAMSVEDVVQAFPAAARA